MAYHQAPWRLRDHGFGRRLGLQQDEIGALSHSNGAALEAAAGGSPVGDGRQRGARWCLQALCRAGRQVTASSTLHDG